MRRFEVKREMRDGGKIRPDDAQNDKEMSIEDFPELYEETQRVGFDDDMSFNLETTLDDLSEDEIRGLIAGYKNRAMGGELDANLYLATQSKKLGVDKKEFEKFLKKKINREIKSPEKVLHYHRTSKEYAQKIIESGYLLNRKNILLNGGDISKLNGSSSVNVQFTRDVYDENGILQSPGFDMEDDKGANSREVVFVMNPELMQEESYNSAYRYPIVEKADIKRCCAAILAQTPEIKAQIDMCLASNGITTIATMLQEEFDREKLLECINGKDLQNDYSLKNDRLSDIDTHENCIYKYTDEVSRLNANCFSLYCDYINQNDIDMTEEGQKEFVGKALGEEYAKAFSGSDKKQLAQIFGSLDYDCLYDTQMNYNENSVLDGATHQKYLLGLQQMKTDKGDIFVAQYEESLEDGEPFETIYKYYTLDENGKLILLEEKPQFEPDQQPTACITQDEIAEGLSEREDILIDSDKKVLDGIELRKSTDFKKNQNKEKIDVVPTKEEQNSKVGKHDSFEQSLEVAGFGKETIDGLKHTIQTVPLNVLYKMDNTLSKTNEKTLVRGGKRDAIEPDER